MVVFIYLLIPMIMLLIASGSQEWVDKIRPMDQVQVLMGILIFIIFWPLFMIARIIQGDKP